MKAQLDLIGLVVEDMGRSLAFYWDRTATPSICSRRCRAGQPTGT
jgi:hypothetical protein